MLVKFNHQGIVNEIPNSLKNCGQSKKKVDANWNPKNAPIKYVVNFCRKKVDITTKNPEKNCEQNHRNWIVLDAFLVSFNNITHVSKPYPKKNPDSIIKILINLSPKNENGMHQII